MVSCKFTVGIISYHVNVISVAYFCSIRPSIYIYIYISVGRSPIRYTVPRKMPIARNTPLFQTIVELLDFQLTRTTPVSNNITADDCTVYIVMMFSIVASEAT